MKQLPRADHPNVEYLYTIPQVAEYFNVDDRTVRQWINFYGVLKGHRIRDPKKPESTPAWESPTTVYITKDSIIAWAKVRLDLK